MARIDRSWGSGPGTHGGHLAALGLAAMQARLVGEFGEDRPVRALATHFLARVGDRPLALHAVVERVGRDAAVCSVRAEQGGALVLVGSATFGASRSGPEHHGSCARHAAILEVGAGARPLTVPLRAERGCRVTAVEIGEHLADRLRSDVRGCDNVDVVCALGRGPAIAQSSSTW